MSPRCRRGRRCSVGSLDHLLSRWVGYPEILALKFPPALRTVRELLPVSVTRFEVIEEYPQVAASDPPELSPQVMTLPARATHHDHPLTSSECSFCGLYRARYKETARKRPTVFRPHITTSGSGSCWVPASSRHRQLRASSKRYHYLHAELLRTTKLARLPSQ